MPDSQNVLGTLCFAQPTIVTIPLHNDVTNATGTGYNRCRKILWLVIAAGLWLPLNAAMAVDGFRFSGGKGSDQVDALGISAQWQWAHRWLHRGEWLLTGYWDVGLDYWNNEIKVTHALPENIGATHEIKVARATPVFRWQRETPTAQGWVPFLDAGTGISILSNRRLASKGVRARLFGIRFQFVSFVGVGMRFGEEQRFEVNLRKYHYSNAELHRFNMGMDLIEFSYGYWF